MSPHPSEPTEPCGGSSSVGVAARMVNFFIDRDGRSYGDELERLRYYEAHSALLQMQAIVSFLVGAIAIIVSSERTANVVYWVVLTPQLANFVALAYLNKRHVRVVELSARSRRRAPFWLMMSSAALFVGAWGARNALAMDGETFAGFGVGIAVTLSVALVVALVKKRRALRQSQDL
jgi:hypothetical protein